MSILTFEQQQKNKPISENNRRDFSQINDEVYEVRIVPMFGTDFLIDVESNLTNVVYKKLLFGCTYTISDSGINYRHNGLLKVIAFFNYAEYSKLIGVEDTFTGYVKANRGEMERANEGEVKEITNFAYKLAYTEAERVKNYLDNNCDTFTKWKTTAIKDKVTAPSFIRIKKK